MTATPEPAMVDHMGYPGGKNGSGVYQRIINLMPPHERYFEPFLGGGAIMRLKRPAAQNFGFDLVAPSLLSVSAALAADGGTRAPSLPAMVASPDGSGGKRSRIDAPGVARRRPSPDQTMPPAGSPAGVSPKVACLQPRLSRRCGIRALESITFGIRDLIYCDPPYLMETRSGRRMYEHEMSDVDHRRLLRCIRTLPAMVMISGYWSKLYARELRTWNSIHFEAMTRGGLATEWLWFNFPVPDELHDYRYLGEGYRERERIAKKKRRWVARLERMPMLERQALLSAISETRKLLPAP